MKAKLSQSNNKSRELQISSLSGQVCLNSKHLKKGFKFKAFQDNLET